MRSRDCFADDNDQADGHSHFIDVLIRVAQTLAQSDNVVDGAAKNRINEEGKGKREDGRKTAEPLLDFVNRFKELAVQDSGEGDAEEEEEEELVDLLSPSGGVKVEPGVSFSVEYTMWEALEDLTDFFMEVEAIRNLIKASWDDYLEGKIDLVTASVTTNTALEMIRINHEAIAVNAMPFFKHDIEVAINKFCRFWTIVFSERMNIDTKKYPQLARQLNDSARDIAMFDAMMGINTLHHLFKSRHFNIFAHRLENYTPPADTRNLTRDQRFGYVLYLIIDTFAQYDNYHHQGHHAVAQLEGSVKHIFDQGKGAKLPKKSLDRDANWCFFDENIVEWANFAKTGRPTLLLVSMAAIHTDIRIKVGERGARCREEMRQAAAAMTVQIRDLRQLLDAWGPSRYERDDYASIIRLGQMCNMWAGDSPLLDIEQEYNKLPAKIRPSQFLDHAPMFCGLVLFHLKVLYRDLGRLFANKFKEILPTIHILEVFRYVDDPENILKFGRYKQLDDYITWHGRERIFGGKEPASIGDVRDSFLYCAGRSPEMRSIMRRKFNPDSGEPSFMRNRHAAIATKSKKGVISDLPDKTVLLPILYRKYGSLERKLGTGVDMANLEWLLLKDMPKLKTKTQKESYNPRIRKAQHLLPTLQNLLHSERPALDVDYMHIALGCGDLVFSLPDSLPYLARLGAPLHPQWRGSVTSIADVFINFVAACVENGFGIYKFDSTTELGTVGDLLLKTAEVINSFLKEAKEIEASVLAQQKANREAARARRLGRPKR